MSRRHMSRMNNSAGDQSESIGMGTDSEVSIFKFWKVYQVMWIQQHLHKSHAINAFAGRQKQESGSGVSDLPLLTRK